MKSISRMLLLKVSLMIASCAWMAGDAAAQTSVRRQPRTSTTTQAKPADNKAKPQPKVAPPVAQPQKPTPQKPAATPATPVKKGDTLPMKRTTAKKDQAAATSEVSVRRQAFDEYQRNHEKETSWQRVVYREIDVMQGGNASLYYPQEPMDGLTNFFRVILDLVTSGRVVGYEYLDGREVFADKYAIKVKEMLDKFQVLYTVRPPTPGSKQPTLFIEEADVPCNEVLSYYIKERWEFDHHTSRYAPRLLAICPVLHRAGDWGGEAVKYPMFWINFEDLRPHLRGQLIMSDGMNNAARYTMEDFFTLEHYKGDIYKVQNVRGMTLMQQYPNADTLRMVRDRLEAELRGFADSIWVREPQPEVEAPKKKSTTARQSASTRTETTTDAATTDKRNRRTKEAVDVEAAQAKKDAKVEEVQERAKKTGVGRSVRRSR